MSIPSSQAPVAGRGCPSGPSRQPRQRRALCSGSRRSCSVAVHSFLGPGGSLNRSLLSILSPAAVPPQELEIVAKPSLDPLDSELGWRNGLNKAYSIGAVIGAGAHGKVYIGRDRQNGQEVAIKMMPKVRGKQTRQSTLRSITREAALMQQVMVCGGAANLLDCFEDASSAYLVQELCKGGDLRRHVETRGPLDEAALANVARELLLLLQCCHGQGLLYADIKPANICIVDQRSGPRNLRAVDFGCAQRLDATQRSTKRTGTMAFMAPETFARNFSYKADVWSLGVTLYWLYAYRLPYWSNADMPRAPSVDQMAAVAQTAPIPLDYGPWTSMSADGRDFVASCLQRYENERIAVSEALNHPWIKRHMPRSQNGWR